MRIVFVHFPSDLYGAGRSLVRLSRELLLRGHEVHVLLARDGPLQNALNSHGVIVHVQRAMGVIERLSLSRFGIVRLLMRSLVAIVDTVLLLRSLRPDIVHTNTGIVFSGAIAARLAGIPHVWHIRDWFGEFPRMWRGYSRMILALSRRVLCVSGPIAAQFPPSEKVRTLHNGFDITEFESDVGTMRRTFREAYGIGEGSVIGTVGRIKLIRKGQEVFVQAASMLKERGFEATFVIVGSAYPGNESHETELRSLIRRFGLEESVILTGEIEDAKPAYAAMDVVVLPSAQPEPFGGVVMEAMAMGRPVVATNIGGSPEQVVDGVTGILVPPNDPAALTDSLARLLSDATFRASCGAAGRSRVEKEFKLSAMVDQITDIYSSIRNGRI